MTENLNPALVAIARGDKSALNYLYELTGAKLFGICMKLLGNRADAEDALQDVYLKIWQRAGQYDPSQDKALAWLCSLTRYHCLNKLRSRRINTAREHNVDIGTLAASSSLEQGLENKQLGTRLDHCLNQLEAPRGEAVRRAYAEGYSYKELADRFQIPINTMRTWLRRGLATLKTCMQEA